MALNREKVYYNVNIAYNPDKGVDNCAAEVQYDSGETILGRASDYYASVVNFSLPVSSIPIFFTDIEPFPNVDINKTVYQIALEFDGQVVTRSVTYVPSDSLYPPPSMPTASNTAVARTLYYAIYTYNRFINMINTAYQDAFNLLVGAPIVDPPKLVYDPNTARFKLHVDPVYLSNGLTPIKVYMGYKLLQFFTGFNVSRTGYQQSDARDFMFNIVENDNRRDDGLLILDQDYSTISNWNCLRSVQLRSPGGGTSDEFVPSTRAGSDGRSAKAAILASFNPIYENSPGSAVPRSQIQFSLNSAYRLIDMITTAPLTRVSIAVWWADEQNNTYRLILQYRELIQVKLCFHLRETFSG